MPKANKHTTNTTQSTAKANRTILRTKLLPYSTKFLVYFFNDIALLNYSNTQQKSPHIIYKHEGFINRI